MQLFPAFVGFVDRQKKRRRIGHVNQHRQTQPAAGLPNRVPARVVDLEQAAVRVFVFQAKLLEDLDAAGAALFGTGELLGNPACKIGPLAIPGRRIVGLAAALPVDIGKDRESVAILRPEQLGVLVEQLAPLPVEADADRDLVAIHQFHPPGKLLGRAAKFVAKVGVNIDHGKLGPRKRVLRHLEHRLGPKILQ